VEGNPFALDSGKESETQPPLSQQHPIGGGEEEEEEEESGGGGGGGVYSFSSETAEGPSIP